MKNHTPKNQRKLPFLFQWLLGLAAAVAIVGGLMYLANAHRLFIAPNLRLFRDQCDLLQQEVLTQGTALTPEGEDPAVFLSVCDPQRRARVFSGTGETLEEAWSQAVSRGTNYLRGSKKRNPMWIKADVVCRSRDVSGEALRRMLEDSRDGFFRWGLSLDSRYRTAFLEAEMNSCGIYDYERANLDLGHLNHCLERADRPHLEALPRNFRLFQTKGWLCQEDQVFPLNSDGLSYGRREIPRVDGSLARDLIEEGGAYLFSQLQEDGSFLYGFDPRFDRELEGYNILRHSGTLWSLTCRQRLFPDEQQLEQIRLGFDYLLSQIVEAGPDTAYVLEADSGEFKLGGCGLAVIALTEYMDLTGDRQYEDVCIRLGNGILRLQDPDTGEFYHVLNSDLSPKEKVRTVYYDGEAAFALCRLYSLTGDSRWLEAVELSMDYFIREDYARHGDQWISYSINELTRYVDNPAYYQLGLENFQRNVEKLNKETIAPTYLELACCTYELWQRMEQKHISVDCEFHPDHLLDTIRFRTQRLLDSYFYPEYAMYMRCPRRVLGSFYVRHDEFRSRIDDVQHTIGSLILFERNYDALVKDGF